MHHSENPLPARKACEARREFPVVPKSIIRGLLHICCRRPPHGEVNHQRTGNDRLPRNESPEARIFAVVAIVPQHEIFARGHDQLSVAREALQLSPPRRVDIGVCVDLAGEIIAKWIGRRRFEGSVRLIEGRAVHRHSAIFNANVVAGNADDTLYKVRRIGMVEYDDVSALNVSIGHEPANQSVLCAWGREDLFVHQEKIADEKRVLHAFRWNKKWLKDKCEKKQRDHDGAEQGGKRLRHSGQMQSQMRHLLRRTGNLSWGAHCFACSSFCAIEASFPTSAVNRTSARRAASCSASFFVVPMPRANALPGSPCAGFSLTSTRKRL